MRHDHRLQHVVALKVLPSERLAGEERGMRFVREARTAASVTHSNIAVIHEIDEAESIVVIALGTTLPGELMILRTRRARTGDRTIRNLGPMWWAMGALLIAAVIASIAISNQGRSGTTVIRG